MKTLFLSFGFLILSGYVEAQDNSDFILVNFSLNSSKALPFDSKVKNRPDYLKQNDKLNFSFQALYGVSVLKRHSFLVGFGYENRFTYSDKFHFSDYCGMQIKDFTKIYKRNINSIAFSSGILFVPLQNAPKLGIGVYFNFGLTFSSNYIEEVEGDCAEVNNYFEKSNGNIFYSSNLFVQYDLIKRQSSSIGLSCKVSHRSYRFFFSDLNYGLSVYFRHFIND